MEDPAFLPQPPDDPRQPEKDLCRLWIGNLDPKLTEYYLLKMIQQTGVLLRHFDFLYHKTGPEKGKPRGYCFITVSKPDEAVKVMNILDGKLALSRKLVVRLASAENRIEESYRSVSLGRNMTSELPQQQSSNESKIKAIEAKLRLMEENTDVTAFQVSPHSVSPFIASPFVTTNTEHSESRSERKFHRNYQSRDCRFKRSRVPYNRRPKR